MSMTTRLNPGGLDTSHGVILYLEDITVSFDGFKALNNLTLDIGVGELRCVFNGNGVLDNGAALGGMRLFAQAVLPAVRDI